MLGAEEGHVGMNPRTRLTIAALATIMTSVALTLVLTELPLRDELTVAAYALLVGLVAAMGFATFIVGPLERERRGIEAQARGELRASVRRFGEALRSTTLDQETDGEPDLSPLLSVVLETGLAAVDGTRGVVLRYSRSHARLERVSTYGLDFPKALPVTEGLAGWVASHRTGMRLPSRSADSPECVRPEPDVETAIAVPLESPSGLFGVLAIYGRESGGSFDDDDLEILTSLGRQASVGADNILLHHQAQRLSSTDPLTGIANYRAFQQRLAIEFERAVRFERPLSLVIVDIDYFKLVNDEHGHQRGDSVLSELAARMVASTRASIDLVARYGGEEFVLLLPETDPEGAEAVAEKVRQAATNTPFAGGEQHLHCTVSAGYASFPAHAGSPEELIQFADLAMYEAKRAGRNRVFGAGPRTSTSV